MVQNGNNSDIDINNLSEDQRYADAFFRRRVPSLAGDVLANGEQNGDYFRFQYVDGNAPLTITEVEADIVDDTSSDTSSSSEAGVG